MSEIILNGSAGKIECKYHHSDTPNAPIALVLPPHPMQGATMNNIICKLLFNAFIENDFSVIRMNFRGVGKTEGVYSKGEGETLDAALVVEWMQYVNHDTRDFWIGGYAFGAWVAMQILMRRPESAGFVMISPPASTYDFSFLAPCPASGLIVHGAKDILISTDSVLKLSEKILAQRCVNVVTEIIEDADHFYVNKIAELTSIVNNYIKQQLLNNAMLKNSTHMMYKKAIGI